MTKLHCNCADHDKHPGDGFATSEGCPEHDPTSKGECASCRGMLVDTGAFEALICDACGDEWPIEDEQPYPEWTERPYGEEL